MFEFNSAAHGDAFRSLKGLVNKNQGVWKTRKQREFLLRAKNSPLAALTLDNVRLEAGERAVCVRATATFGRRTMPVTWMFILDEAGVKKLMRVRKTQEVNEVEWERQGNPDVSHLEETPEEIEARENAKREQFRAVISSRHVGTVGERTEFTFKVIRVLKRSGPMGEYILNILNDSDGNAFMCRGKALGAEGETVRVRATVRDHFQGRDGQLVTMVNRPYMIKE